MARLSDPFRQIYGDFHPLTKPADTMLAYLMGDLSSLADGSSDLCGHEMGQMGINGILAETSSPLTASRTTSSLKFADF
jgi:hypothetical protein